MTPSKYQIDFWNAVENTADNIIVQAACGSGKTTSIVESLKFIPKYKKSIFLAFTKSIQLELEDRIPDHIDCMTLHSLGYRVIQSHFKTKLMLDQYKTLKFSNPLVRGLKNKEGKDLSYKEQLIYKFTISDLIDMARITYDTSVQGFKNVEKNYDIVCKNGEIKNAINVFDQLSSYNRGRNKNKSIDYVDMLHLPVHLNIEIPKYDYVITDEVQDFSNIQHELIGRLLKPNGRLIGVGDRNQAIYDFIGANSNSMDILKEKFQMKEYPLSVTYRVPKSGVELLKQINPLIECPDSAIEGEIRHGDLSEVREGDLVICRNTKPLISAYFELLNQEKKSTIVGKEMEAGLNKLINKFDGMSIDDAKFSIDKEREYICDQLKSDGIFEPKKHFKYIAFEEKTDILNIFFDKYGSVSLAKSKIHDIFDETKQGIKLMTVHKSKGLESNRVFFITHFEKQKLIPSKYAQSKEQKQQEKNLEYVALSRHKRELIFVEL